MTIPISLHLPELIVEVTGGEVLIVHQVTKIQPKQQYF
jgi:hypothetical protein